MFCPECKGLLYPDGDNKVCRKCGYTQAKDGQQDVVRKEADTGGERMVIDEKTQTLPTTTILCPQCEHDTASWVLRQTRAADEPATRIYQCVKCKHKWREY